MKENVHGITTKMRQRKKSMTSTYKEEFEGSFNLKTSRDNTMHIFFYSNISEFPGNLQVILNGGT